MKKYSYWLLLGAIALQSCNMDLYPEDQISNESYFSSEVELREYTNYFYRLLPDAETMYAEEGEHFLAPTPSDVMMGIRDIHSGDSYWSTNVWRSLRKINYYLGNSSRCKDAEARSRYDGVAYFFRAYFYFGMLERFGAVPYYDEALASDADELLSRPRDSRDVVVSHIIADLDRAIAQLPADHTTTQVNKWTAMALKSRVCLFEGTFRKYHAGDAFNGGSSIYSSVLPWEDLLKQCAEVSRRLMDEGGYHLYTTGETPYQSLFATAVPYGDEVIWGRMYSADLNIRNNAQAWSLARQTGFTKRFMNLYPMLDGTPFTEQTDYDKMVYVDEFSGRDPRMAQTVYGPGFIQEGQSKTSAVNMNQTVTGYKYIKYLMSTSYNNWGSSVTSMPIFRLAEVYLNYAEAKAELGELTQQDLDESINLLRDRVGVGHINLASALAQPDAYLSSPDGYGFSNSVLLSHPQKGIVLEVRRERMIETPLEGLHYWDVMRWREGHLFTLARRGMYFPGLGKYDLTGDGKPNVQLSDKKQSGGIGVTNLIVGQDLILSDGMSGNIVAYQGQEMRWDENRDYLYPVPTQQRALTEGGLSQNPGWVDNMDFN